MKLSSRSDIGRVHSRIPDWYVWKWPKKKMSMEKMPKEKCRKKNADGKNVEKKLSKKKGRKKYIEWKKVEEKNVEFLWMSKEFTLKCLTKKVKILFFFNIEKHIEHKYLIVKKSSKWWNRKVRCQYICSFLFCDNRW